VGAVGANRYTIAIRARARGWRSQSTRHIKTGGATVRARLQGTVSVLYLLLTSAFVTCLVVSNIIAGKLMSVAGFVLPAAAMLFPVTYIFGDVLTEVYGFRKARLAIWTGFAANLLMSAVFVAALAAPHPGFWTGQPAYEAVLGFTPRVVLASLVAYAAGELSNSMILSRLKVLTRGRWLWARTIGSTVVGEAVDTALFLGIAFAGTLPPAVLGGMMLAQYVWKVLYEAAATPLTYVFVRWVKRTEGIDTFDDNVRYSPIGLGAVE
jgi:queuosine precursor transporter